MRFNKVVVYVLSASLMFAFVGCENLNRQGLGAVVGGGLGGLLGSQVGKGKGNTGAIIVGTLLGGFIGGSVGKTMDEVNNQKLAGVLNNAPSHKEQSWKDSRSGNEYSVKPDNSYWENGRLCRRFTMTVIMDGKPETVHGKACRDDQGNWHMVK